MTILSTRLTLTLWYVLISMVISILFSVVIYTISSRELDFGYRRFTIAFEQRREVFRGPPNQPPIDPTIVDEQKNRVKLNLIYINVFILGAAAISGYVLSGRTLLPIQKMINNQKQFISNASHELRTPLTALKTTIEVGLRDPNLDLDQAKGLLDSSLEDVNSLKTLSDDLLALAKIEGEAAPFSINSLEGLVNEAIEKVKPLAKKKNIQINSQIEEIKIEGNHDELVRAFVIVLDNAVKYSNNKSVVDVKSKVTDNKVEISIIDEGPGISKEDLPHVFDRFFRSDKARSASGGYGLGLAIAKSIIELHKGTVAISSTPQKGSTVVFILPKMANRKTKGSQ